MCRTRRRTWTPQVCPLRGLTPACPVCPGPCRAEDGRHPRSLPVPLPAAPTTGPPCDPSFLAGPLPAPGCRRLGVRRASLRRRVCGPAARLGVNHAASRWRFTGRFGRSPTSTVCARGTEPGRAALRFGPRRLQLPSPALGPGGALCGTRAGGLRSSLCRQVLWRVRPPRREIVFYFVVFQFILVSFLALQLLRPRLVGTNSDQLTLPTQLRWSVTVSLIPYVTRFLRLVYPNSSRPRPETNHVPGSPGPTSCEMLFGGRGWGGGGWGGGGWSLQPVLVLQLSRWGAERGPLRMQLNEKDTETVV